MVRSAGLSFDGLSIINSNIISPALVPPTHLHKECFIENNKNCKFSLPFHLEREWEAEFEKR